MAGDDDRLSRMAEDQAVGGPDRAVVDEHGLDLERADMEAPAGGEKAAGDLEAAG